MGKLRPFGKGTRTEEWGFSFGLLLGHLQAMLEEESEEYGPRRAVIIEKVEDACQLLNEVYELTGCDD